MNIFREQVDISPVRLSLLRSWKERTFNVAHHSRLQVAWPTFTMARKRPYLVELSQYRFVSGGVSSSWGDDFSTNFR